MLSIQQEDVLERIVAYGGYVTKEILATYLNNISLDRCYRILKRLEGLGYLTIRDYFELNTEPAVFQVTRKACAKHGRPDAYMRKRHKPHVIRRNLLRSHFLFWSVGNGFEVPFSSSAGRISYLQQNGFYESILPFKIDKGRRSIHVEEYLIRNPKADPRQGIRFVYIDNPSYNPGRQIQHLFGQYRNMLDARIQPLIFSFVTEEEHRARIFFHALEDADYGFGWMLKTECISMGRSYRSF